MDTSEIHPEFFTFGRKTLLIRTTAQTEPGYTAFYF